MEPCITKNNGFIDKYIGDAILSLFKGSPSDAIQTAIEMNLELSKFNTMMDSPIRIGVGIHAGQMLLGTVGSETRIDGTVAGNEIKVAMQIEELTKKFGVKILISETVKKNLYEKNNYSMRYLGKISIHGLAQELPLYEILNCDSEKIFNLKVETKENFETAVGLLAEWKFSDAKAIFQSILQKNPDDLTANYFLEECNLILRK
jgi:class 3 adenylate cyclase